VAQALGLEAPPQRIEVYDNSHIQGSHAVGAMIVAGPDGFVKNAYRKFTIRGDRDGNGADEAGLAAAIDASTQAASPPPATVLAPGDDYGMMREVLSRRFARALKEDPTRERGTWPDLLLIDGGAGQLSSVQQVLADLGIDDVPVVAIAKGPDRNAGRERLFRPGREPFSLEPKDPVLYYLQRLRDEAHRFAIGTHRARRTKAIGSSPLDEIAGIGARRKKALLHHFGSARGVARAGLADLERVEGISKAVAQKIYDHFHAEP
jgi:excinuclease ABC subunit C